MVLKKRLSKFRFLLLGHTSNFAFVAVAEKISNKHHARVNGIGFSRQE